MKRSKKILPRFGHAMFKKANVVGVGLGYREKGGQQTREQAMLVFVTKKVPKAELQSGDLVPRSVQGSIIDVVEIGEVKLLSENEGEEGNTWLTNRLGRLRPAPGGVSVGHLRVTAGTLGAVVKDYASGARLMLSNNHVLANSTSGEDGRAVTGDPVLQPGSFDGGRYPDDIIGQLERFVPLYRTQQRSECQVANYWEGVANRMLSVLFPRYSIWLQRKDSRENLVDAAVARPQADEDLLDQVLDIGAINGQGSAALGQEVKFSGRTSGFKQGQVIATEVSLYVQLTPLEQAYFTDQIMISAVSQPGDSGSLVVDGENRAVGLLFAGSDRVTICNRVENISRLLEIVF
ncbi:MAG TPA: hypothetical protein GX693_08180 [Firmicutes bacterium]|nr:hypothetical protein [Bacillota bacterium]